MGDLTCSRDKGEHRMKICDCSKDGEVRLLFVAHARPVGDRAGNFFGRQFGGEVGAENVRIVNAWCKGFRMFLPVASGNPAGNNQERGVS